MKKERIASLDCIRAVSALLIVLYHIVGIFQLTPGYDNFPIKAVTPAGNWSIMVVAVFFMISGASLYYNYPGVAPRSLLSFYFKRWRSLFPAFLLVWLCNYVQSVVTYKNFFYAAEPKYLLLSLFGLDGYFVYLHPNFYYTGEWFLGAIIMLYALYPLLALLMSKKRLVRIITTIVISAAFVWLMIANPFRITKSWNLITCLFSFWFGMLFMKHRDVLRKSPLIGILCGIPFFVLLFAPLGIDETTVMILSALFGYLFLDWAADYIFKVPPVRGFLLVSSALSYEIFLVHHSLIYKFMDYIIRNGTYQMGWAQELLFTILIFVPIFLYAKALSLLIKAFFGTKPWKAIEGVFLRH